ncbi:MAG: hypothetical protein ACQET1_03650, partial [Gemmatimonadota bacterium]
AFHRWGGRLGGCDQRYDEYPSWRVGRWVGPGGGGSVRHDPALDGRRGELEHGDQWDRRLVAWRLGRWLDLGRGGWLRYDLAFHRRGSELGRREQRYDKLPPPG